MGALADLRTEVAVALGDACADHANWNVYPLPVESPSPPCYLLLWSDPWMAGPRTPCLYNVALDVRVIGPRIEPDTGLETLEAMVEAAAVQLDKARHPIRTLSAPGPYRVNDTPFQSAVISLTDLINVNGGT